MNNASSEQSALLGVALGGTISVAAADGNFDLWDSIVGISLLVILWAFDHHPDGSWKVGLAFASVYGLSWVITVGVLIDAAIEPDTSQPPYTLEALLSIAVWTVFTIAIYLWRGWRRR
ncbi:MAG TPA: hypothetical protein VJ183_05980 [Chloroflexia bacterium]|nr:hypothetical protein [Chloroflexia bacterium]